jgi:RNA polymerase sigma-70 factor (ECF subfamily)
MNEPVHGQLSQEVLARVVREHAGRLAASLVSLLDDFAAAEDLVQDAVETALRRWPVEGIPERPDAWLFTVARRRGLDVLRRESNYRAKLAQLTWPAPAPRDDRLRLIFTCCHPALSRAAQIALTLRVVCGLSAAQIAAAFLEPESTVAQRITRAKRKIGERGSRTASLPSRSCRSAWRRCWQSSTCCSTRATCPVRRSGCRRAIWSTRRSGWPRCW